MRALSWFGVDDHGWSPKIPLYGGAVAVHRSYDDGNCSARVACRQDLGLPGYMMEFDWDAAFWVNTAVAKMVYAETNRAASIVKQARCSFEEFLAPIVTTASNKAKGLFESGDIASGIDILTSLAVMSSAEAHKRWTALWKQLMVVNADGYIATENADNLMCGCSKTSATFSTEWGNKVIADTGIAHIIRFLFFFLFRTILFYNINNYYPPCLCLHKVITICFLYLARGLSIPTDIVTRNQTHFMLGISKSLFLN